MATRQWTAALALLTLVLIAAPRVHARGDLELGKKCLVLKAGADLGISRKTGYEYLKQGDNALRKLEKLIGLDESGIFFTNVHAPWWMPDPSETRKQIVIRLSTEVGEQEGGYSAYLARMAKGTLEIVLPVPVGEALTAEEQFKVRAAVAEAAIAQSFNGGLPLWLRRGLPLVIAEASADNPAADTASLRKTMTESVATVNAAKLISALAGNDFDGAGGTAASWALIRLLNECDDDLLAGVLASCWNLSTHLARRTSNEILLREFTAIVRGQIEAVGIDPKALAETLRLWVRGGFLEGNEFRRSDIGKRHKRLKKPKQFRVGIAAGWMRKQGSGMTKTDSLQFNGAKLNWHLPWADASVQATVALVKTGGVNYFRARSPTPARGWESGGPWKGKADGRIRLKAQSWVERRGARSWGLVLVRVTSPKGTSFIWFEEMSIR